MNEILILVVVAFASGLLFPAFYAIIGAPALVPDQRAGIGAQFVKTMQITKPGMIFRAYGKWLCERQNAWEQDNDKGRFHIVKKPERYLSLTLETSYGRDGHGMISIPKEGYFGVDLFPGESAILKYTRVKDYTGLPINQDSPVNEEKQLMFEPMYPDWDRSKMPISIYKALGICGLCTTFWILVFNITVCISFGLFSASIFWLIGPAYGIAAWASTLYEA